MQKIINEMTWKVAGEAGHGILNAGLVMFAKSCVRAGMHVFATAEYPSLIRGGHNHLDVRVSETEIHSQQQHVDLLVALNKESITRHAHKMSEGGGIIYDGDDVNIEGSTRRDIKLYPVPLMKIANTCGGTIMRNTVAIGATFALTGFDIEILNTVIRDNFVTKKGEIVALANIAAAKAGYDYVKNNFKDDFAWALVRRSRGNKIFLSGNEATVAGALRAGCKFVAAYPMTPTSSVLMLMAGQEKDYHLVVKQTEDEIAAINMAIGASFAGARSMVATSGGGFSLMVEGLGLAAQTETPLVIVEGQRPGPATGMATHSGQADLRFVLHASTDEFPRIVIVPGDVEDSFHYAIKAFDLADRYQMPVIILTDKYVAESYKTTEEFATDDVVIDRGLLSKGDVGEGYLRYKVTVSGSSLRSVPGQKGGRHVASSYEHDEHGFEREEEEVRIAMHNKRFRKLEHAAKELPQPELYGAKEADMTIISWGSPKGPIREAMKLLAKEGITINYLQIVFLSPFPSQKVRDVIKSAKHTVIIENNKTSQLSSLIREHCLCDADFKMLKYDGRPFYPEEIAAGVRKLLRERKLSTLEFSKGSIIRAV
ncbi:MAG: 2-oxoacid:acceptor oxidoreductase subunit alpha [Candidatus Aenigmarchaeota archaeon]|nr:2-oxoacid:acceptor oxidoreductase subunit alpha [Candidatus Aenigmarchaeota archaeon]